MDQNGVQWNKMELSDILTGYPGVEERREIGRMADFFFQKKESRFLFFDDSCRAANTLLFLINGGVNFQFWDFFVALRNVILCFWPIILLIF